MTNQMTLFTGQEEQGNIQDVRTDVQQSRKVSYDVGEEIGGAKKHLAELRQQFENAHDESTLRELEEQDQASAYQLLTKHEVFKSFSLENEADRDVEAPVAYFKKLVIGRIIKQPKDSREERERFLKASNELLDELNDLYCQDDLERFVHTINRWVVFTQEKWEATETELERIFEVMMHEDDEARRQHLIRQRRRLNERLERMRDALDKPMDSLGESFCNLFTKQSSLNSTLKRVQGVHWDDLLQPKQTKAKGQKRQRWERDLPERPDRHGGVNVSIDTPEEMVELFGFKGIQFGHYVSDHKATEHIIRSTEALYDLTDVLQVTPNALSFGGQLSLAFGARGSGKALGHYEPLHQIINFTKEKGTLGIMAHEWFHGLDHYIGSSQSDKVNAKLSDDASMSYDWIPEDIRQAMHHLLDAMKLGETFISVPNRNKPGQSWTISQQTKRLYLECINEVGVLDIETFSDKAYNLVEKEKQKHVDFLSRINKDDKTSHVHKKYDKKYENMLQAIAYHHKQVKGEFIPTLPKKVKRSPYYQQTISLDHGKEGKYFSSNVELVARAFEAYIQDKLESGNRRNDYLVAGTHDSQAYPTDETRQRINRRVAQLIYAIKENGSLQ